MFFFFFKQKTAYEMRISDWSSYVCSSDLKRSLEISRDRVNEKTCARDLGGRTAPFAAVTSRAGLDAAIAEIGRSEEHTSELQSLMRISYAVFCLKKNKLTSAANKDRNRETTSNKPIIKKHEYDVVTIQTNK